MERGAEDERKKQWEKRAEESLSQFCIVSKDKSYRIKGEYMNIPPILSILHPSIDIF